MKTHHLMTGLLLLGLALPALADGTDSSVSQETLKVFTFKSQQAPIPAAPTGATEMAPVHVIAPPNHTYADVNEAAATSDLLAPCMLVTRNFHSGVQFQALGAPLKPRPDDSAGTQLQARFPLIGIAW